MNKGRVSPTSEKKISADLAKVLSLSHVNSEELKALILKHPDITNLEKAISDLYFGGKKLTETLLKSLAESHDPISLSEVFIQIPSKYFEKMMEQITTHRTLRTLALGLSQLNKNNLIDENTLNLLLQSHQPQIVAQYLAVFYREHQTSLFKNTELQQQLVYQLNKTTTPDSKESVLIHTALRFGKLEEALNHDKLFNKAIYQRIEEIFADKPLTQEILGLLLVYSRPNQRTETLLGYLAELSGKKSSLELLMAQPETPWQDAAASVFSWLIPGKKTEETVALVNSAEADEDLRL